MAVKKKRTEGIRKPFLRGRMTDRNTPWSVLRFCGAVALLIAVNLLLSAVMTVDLQVLRTLISVAIIAASMLVFFRAGRQRGV